MDATDYEFYEEGIRPKEAGEVWKLANDLYAIGSDDKGLYVVCLSWFSSDEDRSLKDMIHGQSGWQRKSPPVQDNDIERVEIEGIEWVQDQFGVYPKASKDFDIIQGILGKRGKLIFIEYKKKGEG